MKRSPFTNVYGVARTLLALGTLMTLATSTGDALFRPISMSSNDAGQLSAFAKCGLFVLLAPHYEVARWVGVLVLAVVASGWRPRWTGILHWWVSASAFSALITMDGGDQCTSVLTLVLVPLTLCDSRRWHWSAERAIQSARDEIRARIGASAFWMARLQVAIIYLHAAVGKCGVDEWSNGTAIYYWLTDPSIAVPVQYQDWVLALLAPRWSAPALTWGVIVLEYALFLAIAMSKHNPLRKWLLWIGLGFHVGNVLFFGLVSFMFAMSAALVLLLRPHDRPIQFPSFAWPTEHWPRRFSVRADRPLSVEY